MQALKQNKYTLEIKIEGLPKIVSNGSHGSWRAQHGQKKKWKQLTFKALLGKLPAQPLVTAKCTFTRASSMEPDDDNMRISFKPVRDALVEMGVLVDDKPVNMPEPAYLWLKAPRNQGYIMVKVEEM